MKISKYFNVVVMAAIVVLGGCAAVKPDMDIPQADMPALKASFREGVAKPTVDANGLEVSAAVKAGLVEAFEQQAAKDGIRVSPTGAPVKITIEEYSTRSNAARVLLGVLAGRDHIKARVEVVGRSYEVEDSAHSAINGIDEVAKNVGIEAANGVAELAGLPVVTDPPPSFSK